MDSSGLLIQVTPKTVTRTTDADLDEAAYIPLDQRRHLRVLLPLSLAWTGRIDGVIVAIAGVTEIHPGHGEVWSYLTPRARDASIWLSYAVARRFRRFRPQYFRLQASTDEHDRVACRWLEWLGFHVETRRRLAGAQRQTILGYVCFPQELT